MLLCLYLGRDNPSYNPTILTAAKSAVKNNERMKEIKDQNAQKIKKGIYFSETVKVENMGNFSVKSPFSSKKQT